MCVGFYEKESIKLFWFFLFYLFYTGPAFSFLTCSLWMAGRVKKKKKPSSQPLLLLLSSQHSRPRSSWERRKKSKIQHTKKLDEEDNNHCLEAEKKLDKHTQTKKLIYRCANPFFSAFNFDLLGHDVMELILKRIKKSTAT